MEFTSDKWTVLMIDEPTYTFGSADNVRTYEHEYDLASPSHHPASKHGIIAGAVSAVIGAGGGCSAVHKHSLVIVGDHCFVAVGDYVCCLKLPELTLVWQRAVDSATCFGLFYSAKQQALISHGECEISRLSLDGKVVWATGGKDIFSEGFQLLEDHVEAIDFNGDKYRIEMASGQSQIVSGMTIKKRKARLLAVALLILGGAGVAFCLAYDRYEKWHRAEPQRLEAKQQARLNQQVRGYVSDDAMRHATFRMTSESYWIGYLNEWEYAGGSTVYREQRGMRGIPVTEKTIQLDETQRSLLADVLNLVAKQKLWNQSDLEVPMTDGGVLAYKFSVGDHRGQFKLINANPPHIDIFRHKCWMLMQSLRDAPGIPEPDKIPEKIGASTQQPQR
jgi:hypothetical protein